MNRPLNRTLWKQPGLECGETSPAHRVRALHQANLVGSKLADGRHAPALDLDVPAKLIPSRTEGHSHLYIDVPMSWRQYRRLLKALAKAGVIEPGYYQASVKKGGSFLRSDTYGARVRDQSSRAIGHLYDAIRSLESERNARYAPPVKRIDDSFSAESTPAIRDYNDDPILF